jgi:hypothetical protein
MRITFSAALYLAVLVIVLVDGILACVALLRWLGWT